MGVEVTNLDSHEENSINLRLLLILAVFESTMCSIAAIIKEGSLFECDIDLKRLDSV